MAFKGWYSKQDVIKDLSKATGTCVSDLDEEYVIVGERPPPLYKTADDEEELQLLRLYGGHQPTSPNYTDKVKPDIEGITQMLRMVDDYNDSLVNNSGKETKKQDTNTVITISKLNPNAAEFVPRSDKDIYNTNNVIVANSELMVSEVDDGKHNRRTSENKSTEACDRRSINTLSKKSISINESDEIKEMKDKLKTKITNNNSNSIDLRTYTEQYDEIMERESPIYDSLNNSNNSMTKEIKESIQKVDDWPNPKINADNKTSTTTRPSLYFGPITFKRKNNSKPMSSISVESEELKSQNLKKNNEVFIPSTFASELTKKYEERNKANENQPSNQDI